ncbi:J-type co-chaperone JAC1, mitochondrial [Erysiphe neolycopersici]|uniref:J-type co-chaperone JAC1, mitochondrial n=1 Tax=Erysiphe neolycopersici TaxID=212602 RepID=A0A420HTQ3_9PEZI|nr:J-type co-chaperone JAC1, mitochondrial [Erysiphe neolycopersici]
MVNSAIHKLHFQYCALRGHHYAKKAAVSWHIYSHINQFKLNHTSSKPASNKHPLQTYYGLFPKTLASGPPPTGPFHIDVKALHREFLLLQALAHPDRHANTSKDVAGQESAFINEAFNTLKTPLSRAQYLLSLRDSEIKEEDAKDQSLDSEALCEIMEIREQIDEATPDDFTTLKRLRNENTQSIKECENLIAKAFDDNDLQTAKKQTILLKYWMSISSHFDDLGIPS